MTMYIFYDFETSDNDFLGQLLSYYFVLVDEHYQPIKDLFGYVKVNRLECPRVEAIKTNLLCLSTCNQLGASEHDTAHIIYHFIRGIIDEFGPVSLVGYNSSKFDFKHYEKLLIKHGLSPTFYGKIRSLDVLLFARYCAITHINDFPFVKKERDNKPSFSFRLEDMSRAFSCQNTPQTHDAKDDVWLTIALLKTLEQQFDESFTAFDDRQKANTLFSDPTVVIREPQFSNDQSGDIPRVETNEWLILGHMSPTNLILFNVNKFHEKSPQTFEDFGTLTRYFNPRNHHIEGSCHPRTDQHRDILAISHIKTIQQTIKHYFDLFPNNWDVEYKPWSIGFDQIPTLNRMITTLSNDPTTYDSLIQDWRIHRRKHSPNTPQYQQHNHMIQLFNRWYLNHHPSPDPALFDKYIRPRYIDGTLYRKTDAIWSPVQELKTTELWLASTPKNSQEYQAFKDYHAFTEAFIKTYNIPC